MYLLSGSWGHDGGRSLLGPPWHGDGEVERCICCQVEFPEARIYEETLNILLYENRDLRPDPELMSKTKNNPRRDDSDDDLDEKLEKSDRTGKRK